ncbi:hypothetical protein GCM10012275_64300 [Longimycelium tulufanense]|uniref:Lipoprotein n=1 Tax=Longimycelium tulufanense TaxID=907463 RepID=A0A8J3CKY4_9PSEU|nr:hypothetical protein [Longimycelium tulufanense]GGM84714.1 hypothetical protein GCM10012275_64300 [Longimycelium tulufanense]
MTRPALPALLGATLATAVLVAGCQPGPAVDDGPPLTDWTYDSIGHPARAGHPERGPEGTYVVCHRGRKGSPRKLVAVPGHVATALRPGDPCPHGTTLDQW